MTEQENGKAATDRQAEQTADETLQAFATTESSENRQALNNGMFRYFFYWPIIFAKCELRDAKFIGSWQISLNFLASNPIAFQWGSESFAAE